MASRNGDGIDSMVSEAVIRVRYAETDQMGVGHHSSFIIWFEVGRVELLRQIGFSYREMEVDGYHLPVAEARCRYKSPAFYDDTLVIRTKMVNLRPSMIRFGYEAIRQSDGALLAEGETTHIVVGADKTRVQLPEKYFAPFQQAFGQVASVRED